MGGRKPQLFLYLEQSLFQSAFFSLITKSYTPTRDYNYLYIYSIVNSLIVRLPNGWCCWTLRYYMVNMLWECVSLHCLVV
jgi:hypothetical protein